MKIKGVIFDFDGTLLDSVDVRITSWQEAFKDFGVNVPRDVIKPMIGYPGVDLARKFVNNPLDVEMLQEDYFLKKIDSVKLFQDVIPTIHRLKDRGIKVSVVTSTRRSVMNRFDLPVDTVVTIDDVSKGKPDPEPYIIALKKMAVEPKECVVVGDIENDLVPGKKIMCTTVLVKHGRDVHSPFADYEIENISDLIKIIEEIESKSQST
ncbi:phosphoglycolate phosphatase [Thermoplasma volcanium GSS1]|uniref:Phosphoglycolate phosphatase n=1 Tax=Thermoplasma volcanium (strain ATCC 51530 / DSM 4299 / JCM 9571 / NBRC 15438 / GSS1) TaxID=273116 RepID=Q97A40_THEVO|nr:HAD family phosphatase [Thermoplasma volcanium]BAB60112.1 phosphoglycolate phosphatase [Thermoplasma volcanium GSS1]